MRVATFFNVSDNSEIILIVSGYVSFLSVVLTVGVRQGCVLAPALFCITIDWIMSICADKTGFNVGQSLFTDTDYADDAVLFAEDDVQWTSILESFDTAVNTMGLHTSWAKTKIQNHIRTSCGSSSHYVLAGSFLEAESADSLSTTTKFRIYNSCVLSSLLCVSETWTLLKADIAKLEAFHMTKANTWHLLV